MRDKKEILSGMDTRLEYRKRDIHYAILEVLLDIRDQNWSIIELLKHTK